MVALGAVFGGYLAAHYFYSVDGNIAHVSQATVNSLNELGFNVEEARFHWFLTFTIGDIFYWRGLLIIAGGGFLVLGFGARYAGRCIRTCDYRTLPDCLL
ncbi:MAG: hypothetical protein IPQ03_12505 [Bacteroidetes bacterium]|nr:hypothetical protein [Bacteroidota bacterium]